MVRSTWLVLLMRRVQISVSHSPEDSTRREKIAFCILASKVLRMAMNLTVCWISKEKTKQVGRISPVHTSLVPCPSFQRFTLCVTADQPSVRLSLASASHSHITAFRRSLTEPRESRATTSCEYTRETIKFSVKLVKVASVRDLE